MKIRQEYEILWTQEDILLHYISVYIKNAYLFIFKHKLEAEQKDKTMGNQTENRSIVSRGLDEIPIKTENVMDKEKWSLVSYQIIY